MALADSAILCICRNVLWLNHPATFDFVSLEFQGGFSIVDKYIHDYMTSASAGDTMW